MAEDNDPFAGLGQPTWEPFDAYKTPDGIVKNTGDTDDYFHQPLVDPGSPFNNPEVSVIVGTVLNWKTPR